MNNNLTELVFILDKSGSMLGLEKDTIGGFNSMMQKQKDVEGDCVVTTVLFDNEYQLLHDRINLKAINPITEKEYFVGGTTALLDAIGTTIRKIDAVQEGTAEEYRAGKVLFVIITDGEENSSERYSAKEIKRLISERKERNGWEFIFLGANIDAVETADRLGISQENAAEYICDEEGTILNYKVMDSAVRQFRSTGCMAPDCLDEIRKDKKRRKTKKQ